MGMNLILWRHADAEDGIPDEQRRLTAKGQKQAKKMYITILTILNAKIL